VRDWVGRQRAQLRAAAVDTAHVDMASECSSSSSSTTDVDSAALDPRAFRTGAALDDVLYRALVADAVACRSGGDLGGAVAACQRIAASFPKQRPAAAAVVASLAFANGTGSDDGPSLPRPLQWCADTATAHGNLRTAIVRAHSLRIGKPFPTALEEILESGMSLYPMLAKVSRLKSLSEDTTLELPSVPNPRYSSFQCPVTKAMATSDSPPVLLRCNHAISQQALHHLTRRPASMFAGGPLGAQHHRDRAASVRCPYCSVETDPATVRVVLL
jgi:hypothetical protein